MAILKCKMCGGDIELSADKTFGTCEFCGSTMTFPKVDDEQRAAAFNRGNHFRRTGEFDKALAVYERIVQEDENDAEAHWCCALCRFGIEYVEDPNTFEYLPTCHRASFDSFLEDVDYLAALEHSDGITRRQYQKDAQKIAEVQRGILATSRNEEPFDVFLCYKETEDDGSRTRDSLYAQDIYYQLTEQGRRVFFSRITLEDKAGTEYEPYIFAALNSAKVMVLVTTSAEHANAVWVKNEWSRFLSLMRKDRSKLLLPCYRDMDPYDLPEALSVLQSYDMSKIGFIQDLIRGVNKVLEGSKPKQATKETVVVQQQSGHAAPLLERAFMFLEDGDWAKADDFCEQVLNLEPKNALAYLGKLMAELKVRKRGALKDCTEPFDESSNYQKALRFGDEKLKVELSGDIAFINDRNETARREEIYQTASEQFQAQEFLKAKDLYDSIPDYRDSVARSKACEEAHKETIYRQAEVLIQKNVEENLALAIERYRSIPGWRDADEKLLTCQRRVDEIRKKKEANRLESDAIEKASKKRRRIIVIVISIILVGIVLTMVTILNQKYNKAIQLYNSEQYEDAIIAFTSLRGYRDSSEQIDACKAAIDYQTALTLNDAGQYIEAMLAFRELGSYKDAQERCFSLWGRIARRSVISAGAYSTLALNQNGYVDGVGKNDYGQLNTYYWRNMVDIAASWSYTIGLKGDGTVVATGDNSSGQCDVDKWEKIVAVAASTGNNFSIGLKEDGTVISAGKTDYGKIDVSSWQGIIAVAAGSWHVIGLKEDGTVTSEFLGSYRSDLGQCDLSNWKDIIAIAAGDNHSVGLKSNGTVVAAGLNEDGQCKVSNWTDIVAIAAGEYHTVGLKTDGTVVVAGSNRQGQCDVSTWTDIVAIAAGSYHTVGLKVDGTVVATGYNDGGQCDILGLTNIKLPEQ